MKIKIILLTFILSILTSVTVLANSTVINEAKVYSTNGDIKVNLFKETVSSEVIYSTFIQNKYTLEESVNDIDSTEVNNKKNESSEDELKARDEINHGSTEEGKAGIFGTDEKISSNTDIKSINLKVILGIGVLITIVGVSIIYITLKSKNEK